MGIRQPKGAYMVLETAIICAVIFLVNFGLWQLVNPRHFGQDAANMLCVTDHAIRGRLRLYRDCFPSSPGLVVHLFLLVKMFGLTNHRAFTGFHILVSGLTGVATTITGSLLAGTWAGLAAGLLMVVFLTSPRLNGNWGSFEQLMALPVTTALMLLCLAGGPGDGWMMWVAGACLGYAALIRIFALAYLPAYLIIGWGLGLGWELALMGLGGLLLVQLLPLVWFAISGRLGGYIATYYLLTLFALLKPARFSAQFKLDDSQKPPKNPLAWSGLTEIFRSMPPLILAAAAGLVAMATAANWHWTLGLLAGILASAAIMATRRKALPQYGLNFLVWLCLPAGQALTHTMESLTWTSLQAAPLLALLALAWLLGLAVLADKRYYYPGKDPFGWLRKAHGEHMVTMYQNHRVLAERIKQATGPDDSILLVGNPLQIMLYSERDHFLADFNLNTDTLFTMYQDSDTSPLKAINQWLGFNLAPERDNPFRMGKPALIMVTDGNNSADKWEQLLSAPLERDPRFPELPVWRINQELGQILQLYDRIDKTGPEITPQINERRGRLLAGFQRRDWDAVKKELEFLIPNDPLSTLEYTLILGDALFAQNNVNLIRPLYHELTLRSIFDQEQAQKLRQKESQILSWAADMGLSTGGAS
jgi:hypothetical protein